MHLRCSSHFVIRFFRTTTLRMSAAKEIRVYKIAKTCPQENKLRLFMRSSHNYNLVHAKENQIIHIIGPCIFSQNHCKIGN